MGLENEGKSESPTYQEKRTTGDTQQIHSDYGRS